MRNLLTLKTEYLTVSNVLRLYSYFSWQIVAKSLINILVHNIRAATIFGLCLCLCNRSPVLLEKERMDLAFQLSSRHPRINAAYPLQRTPASNPKRSPHSPWPASLQVFYSLVGLRSLPPPISYLTLIFIENHLL